MVAQNPHQRLISQQRASEAWHCIEVVHDENYADKYYQLAKGAPADIQSNGLGQTLAFWKAKGHGEGRYFIVLFNHLSTWLQHQPGIMHNIDTLDWIVNAATTSQYRRATAEAIAFLIWVKRFAEAEQNA